MEKRIVKYKKIIQAILLFALVLTVCIPVSTSLADSNKVWIDDMANLMNPSEEAALEEQLLKVREQKKLDIVIVTTKDADGKSAMAFADDYYDEHNYGYDKVHGTGILYLIDLDNNEIWISTCGDAIYYFTDARIEDILDEVYPAASDKDYAKSAKIFIEQTKIYMGVEPGAHVNKPITVTYVVVSLIVALVIGFIITLIMVFTRGGKVTVNKNTYVGMGDSVIYDKRDIYLRQTVTTRRISTSSSSGGGGSRGGGGSSSHRSSGGISHGGGGRRL